MNCIIIEDEQHAAEYLAYLIEQSEFELSIVYTAESVTDAIEWLKHNTVDLIFLDIQLGDGNGFAIFDSLNITTPIIFTTSHSNFALDAFNVNSVGYLLKPIDQADLDRVLTKLNSIYPHPSDPQTQEGTKKFLVQLPNSLRLIEDHDISYFSVQNKQVFIVLNTGEQLSYDSTLETLESTLNPKDFFRINRQYIVRLAAIKKMHNETRGRVRIKTLAPTSDEMIVSIDRSAEFKERLRS